MTGEGAISTYVLEQGLDGARGFVHSTFRSSLNVAADGFLLHVGKVNDPLSCLGMAVPKDEMRELLGRARQGDLVVFGEGFLRVYSQTGVTRIGYGGYGRVDTRVPRLGEGWSGEALASAIVDIDFFAGIGLHPSHALAEALVDLSRAVEGSADGANLVSGAAEFLVGRGLGLTPSGDDVLAGYGCALWARSREEALAGIRADGLSGRTTDVSVAYLRAMADGHANADFVNLVRALGEDDEGQCRASIAAVLDVGHTSGYDSLLGFVVGMGLLGNIGGPLAFSC